MKKIAVAIVVLLILFAVLFPAAAKKCTPGFIKTYIKDMLGITEMQQHIRVLETAVYESKEDIWSRSRQRWVKSTPDNGLTWGREVTGDAFVDKANLYKGFGEDKVVLEIGPGYGRLLKSIQQKNFKFKKFIGVDISKDVTEYLTKNFGSKNIEFFTADVEKVDMKEKVDVIISSLTFKHLYPSFEPAVLNLNEYLNEGGLYIFDLMEGEGQLFENDGKTYIHKYTQKEVNEILNRCNLELVKFDEVKHDEEHTRMLVVARKR